MNNSGGLAAVLDPMRPHLPPALVSAPAFERLRSLGSTLPGAITNAMYVECRLADAADRVDLVIGVHEPNRAVLEAPPPPPFGPPGFPAPHPVWEGVRNFCRAWSDPARAYHDSVHAIWLEFDLDVHEAARTDAPPGVFVSFGKTVLTGQLPVAEAIASLEILKGAPLAPDVRRTLVGCLEHLEASAYLAYLGVMFSRDAEVVRLCLMDLRGDPLMAYLRAIGWPGSAAALSRQLDLLRCDALRDPVGTVAMLHVDAGRTVGERLGFEFCFNRQSQLKGEFVEDSLLQRLEALQLCSRSKREAFAPWLGRSIEAFDHECWPSLVVRRINHVKVTVENGAVEAKTYLSVFYGPSRARSSSQVTAADDRP